MIGKRTEALLQAAAVLHSVPMGYTREEAVDAAYALLALIEAREKANAPTSADLPVCRNCGFTLPCSCGRSRV